MKKLFLSLSLCLFPLTAYCQVTVENFCFELSQESQVKFELRIYYDALSKWSGASVKYLTSKEPISLVVKYTDLEELDPQMPVRDSTVWLEIVDGKITGEYTMVTQGNSVVSMAYKKGSNGKQYSFSNNTQIKAPIESGCQW
ncbi:hypothetical protein HKK52_21325 [Pseudomonas sp. ADAK2]|uniref:hypothetical protein n=1 Tax=unclassified Pseudomonas TaxID=196821 RepID=UPI001464443B|nr:MULTISPECIES: hypothetical protein [unclassified Pseudomonas]QJI43385.1 hypothetical protein HKK53_21325 [Pseudomonas sp. ADAK7]QJI49687.1 hypothetical protein HKK52_21325 [Pseudomonas sp. ADAK2]